VIYLDNAATTKTSDVAIRAMLPYLSQVYGNPSSLHSAGQRAAEALEEARARVGACIGAAPGEIYFVSGGSEADNQAVLTAAALGRRKGKKHIVSTAIEHHAVLHALQKLQKEGFDVTLVGVGADGVIRAEDVERAIRPDTVLVSVMAANNEIGTLQPIGEVGRICRERGILFHTDAVQAAGHIPLDVRAQNIDMLSISAHKFGGPKGAGVLYARKGVPLYTLIEGGAQERGKRAGTQNVAAIMGMAAALEEACSTMQATAIRVAALRDRLIEGILTIPHSALNGDAHRRLPGNANFCFEGIEGESLLLLLDDKGIAASSGSACTSGSLDPSHVLLAIGRVHDVAHGSLRLTLSDETTAADVDYTVAAVREVVAYLRNMSPIWRDLQEGKRQFIL